METFRDYMRRQTLEQVRLRLSPEARAHDRLAHPLADDLVRTAHVGTDRGSHLVVDNAWLDQTPDAHIRQVATMNTSVELLVADKHVRAVGERVWTLTSSSYSTSALITMLDDDVPVPPGRKLDLDFGVLVSVPTQRTIMFGVLEGRGSFLGNVQTMIASCFDLVDSPDAISQSVYLVDRSGIERVARVEGIDSKEPKLVLSASDELHRRVERGEL